MTNLERARRYVAKCPPAVSGEGGHNATFRVAAVLQNGFALSEAETLALLREWNTGCVPPWTEAELIHKVRSTARVTHWHPRGYLLMDKSVEQSDSPGFGVEANRIAKPKFCPMVLKRIAAKVEVNDVVAFIKRCSPVPVAGLDVAYFLRRLYPRGSGEKVLIFSNLKSQGQFLWDADRSDGSEIDNFPVGGDGVWFLPQPVDGRFHLNPRSGGKPSRRSEESVTAWRYLVLENDEADREDWMRCLIQMPLRIASICESGGRSIHALVRLDAASKVDWDEKVNVMKPTLITLGADPGALTAVRLTRLPQAKRATRLQRLLYFDPIPDGATIYEKNGPGCIRNDLE
jgi:hypothetical protein